MSLPSRFDIPTLEEQGFPGLQKKIDKAIRSRSNAIVSLTKEEAEFLIAESGGPDQNHTIPQEMYSLPGTNHAVVVQNHPEHGPRCWRL